MSARKNVPVSTPADLSSRKALELLKTQLGKLEELKKQDYRSADSAEDEWYNLTSKLIMRSFGSGSPNYSTFCRGRSAGSYIMRMDNYVDHGQNNRNFQSRLVAFESALRSSVAELEIDVGTVPPPAHIAEEKILLVLISHSSKDETLASALIDWLRSGLGLLPEQIRCSSVDGYRLPAGVHTDTQLRAEVRASRVLIGLITPDSLASPYVLFELGARWGAGDVMIPLLAGVNPETLRGPLSGLNALLCSSEEQLHQALRETGGHLGLNVLSPAAYLKQLRVVVAEAARIVGTLATPTSSLGSPEQRPKELRFTLTVMGTPPSPQMISVRSNQVVKAVYLEYLLSTGACIASDNLSAEGESFDIPIQDFQVAKLWNTYRSDRNPNDHSGPAKVRITLRNGDIDSQYTLPIQMDAYFQHGTSYRRLSGTEAYIG